MRYWIILFLFMLTSCCTVQVPEIPPNDARQYLYHNVTMEIQQTTAIGMVHSDLEILKDRFHEYRICRRDRINVVVKPPVPEPVRPWLQAQVVAFAQRHRTLYDRHPDDRHLIVYISLLPGTYAEPNRTNVIGLAFQDQHIALFNNFSFYVLLHEFGHTLGLVDRERREEDPVNPDRPRHCNIKACVMFWQVNKRGRFDSRCLRDLDQLIADRNK